MEEFPSGQRGQTVNLLRFVSMVRIHLPPPEKNKLCLFFFLLYIDYEHIEDYNSN